MWNIEKDPILRSTIVAVAIFDSRSRLGPPAPPHRPRRRASIPRFRQRVLSPPFRIGPPRWTVEPAFDLDFHLRRMRLPRPGTHARAARRAAADRDVELRPGPAAVGVHADRRARRSRRRSGRVRDEGAPLGDRRRRRHGACSPTSSTSSATPPTRATTTCPPRPRPSTSARSTSCASRSATPAGARSASRADSRERRMRAAIVDRCATRSAASTDLVHTTRSIGRTLAPATSPMSPVMLDRGLGRRLDAFDVPLDDLRRAAKAAEGSLNDAFVAAVIGGIRRYHERHGAAPDALRMTLPINLRQGGDDAGGQPVRAGPVPGAARDRRSARAHAGDPAGSCASWRAEPALQMTSTLAGVLNRLPTATTTALFGGMLKCCDFVTSNVPGAPIPVYYGGRARRAAVRVRAAVGRGVQRHADLALRHVLHRHRHRHHRRPRPRRPGRAPCAPASTRSSPWAEAS